MDRQETATLVAQAKAGSTTAQEQLYARCAAKLLPLKLWRRRAAFFGDCVVRVQFRVRVIEIRAAMPGVRAAPGHHIDGGTLAPAVGSRKSLRRNHEFLNCIERQLHDRPAHGIILIIDPIDCHIHVASARAVDPEHGDAIFSGVIGIHGARARRKRSCRRSGRASRRRNCGWRVPERLGRAGYGARRMAGAALEQGEKP